MRSEKCDKLRVKDHAEITDRYTSNLSLLIYIRGEYEK